MEINKSARGWKLSSNKNISRWIVRWKDCKNRVKFNKSTRMTHILRSGPHAMFHRNKIRSHGQSTSHLLLSFSSYSPAWQKPALPKHLAVEYAPSPVAIPEIYISFNGMALLKPLFSTGKI
jgi:hypothetical protein